MKKIWPLVCALLLSACGFTPLYATNDVNGGPQAQFQYISIGNIPDRPGQILRNDLIDRLYTHGSPTDPRYVLTFEPLREADTDLDITTTATSTRAELRLTTAMTLKDRATEKVLLQRDLLAVSAYDQLSSQFTTIVSQEAVRDDALNDLARQAENQLALYFARQSAAK